jgi:Na+/H+-dicarboxylate symporter/ABC-type amino acid transport substrate-binding protein
MKRFSLGLQILVAVVLGIVTGLFFGPLTETLSPIGSAYTLLLQMAVLPYIGFSLVHGLGSISVDVGRKILRSSWVYFLSLWLFIFFLIYLLSSLIPPVTSPLIVSKSAPQIESQFTSNLIAENPFYDILNNIVPAVAISGVIFGLAFMHIEKKEPFISALEKVNQALEKILHVLGLLSPIGAFVYISIAFGTVHFEDLFLMQIYVFAFIGATLFIVFWLLPTLLAALTPLSYKEALSAFRYVCLIPFVTGLSTAALPFINSYLKKLSQKHETHAQFRQTSQTLLPLAYSFGHIGNAMILLFIFFLSYYYRHPFSAYEQGLLSLVIVPLSLGTTTGNINSILFLIQKLGFPEGASTLYLQIKSFTNNFQVLLSIASVFTLLLLSLYSYYGLIQLKKRALILRLAPPFILLIVIVTLLHPFVHPKDVYENLYPKLTLAKAIKNPVQAKVISNAEMGAPRSFSDPLIPEIFRQILETRVLKVGFYSNSVPYCYFNKDGNLVGFDIAYAYELAHDLNCELEFFPLEPHTLSEDIQKGIFDIGMSSIIMNEKRLIKMLFTFPYWEDNNVLVVPREKKKAFLTLQSAKEIEGLKIGAAGAQVHIAEESFPKAKIISLESLNALLEHKIDAFLWSKTTAVIWCLSHPDFVVVDYGGQIDKSYYAYPIRQHAIDFGFFLNSWLTLKDQSGFKQEMIDYWMHGVPPGGRPPRWSILHNVLKWD